MDLVILEKIESSILNGLGYIGRLEKKSGNKFAAKIAPFCSVRLFSHCGVGETTPHS